MFFTGSRHIEDNDKSITLDDHVSTVLTKAMLSSPNFKSLWHFNFNSISNSAHTFTTKRND